MSLNTGRRTDTRPFLLLIIVGFFLFMLHPAIGFGQADVTPVIVDTDMARDDWMALAYLLQQPAYAVLAVSVSGTGESFCDPGVQNTLNLLAYLGRPDIPVACGRETPLLGTNTFPDMLRDPVNAMGGLDLPTSPTEPVDMTAVELLQATIAAADAPVTLLTLGPLTNIAELIAADPTVIDHISMIYTMGGAFDAPGNVHYLIQTRNRWAEWNVYVDPLATAQVVASGVPITFIPLDATNLTPITPEFMDQLAADHAAPAADFVYAVLQTIRDEVALGWHSFWDQLATAAMTDESLVTIEERTIQIITEPGDEFGRVVSAADGYPVRVALAADAAAFEALFLDGLHRNVRTADLPCALAVEHLTDATFEACTAANAPLVGTPETASAVVVRIPSFGAFQHSDFHWSIVNGSLFSPADAPYVHGSTLGSYVCPAVVCQ